MNMTTSWWQPARLRSADRLMLATGALMVFGLLVFAVDLIKPVIPYAVLWAPLPISGTLLVLVYRRTARTAGLPQAVRRFWRQLSVVAALAMLASCAQAVDVLTNPSVPGQHVGPVMQFFDIGCVLVIVYALYRLPLARQTRTEWIRVVLDAGTVMMATAVFLWHFQTHSAVTNALRPADEWAALGLTSFALVAVFGVVKVVLSSETFVDGAALRLFAVAMIIGAGVPLFRDYLEAYRPHLFPSSAGMLIVFFVAALAGERQRKADYEPKRGAAKPRRRAFSLFPYLAVGGVDGLLLLVAFSSHRDQRVIIVAGVLLTVVVVSRQVIAFRENGQLLERLDHGATHDALTRLPNRVLFNKRLQTALTTPGDRPVSVALIDLDDFKEVNDTLGHEVGDLLLVAVAQRLAGVMRKEDMVARLGGDEFVVVLDGADPAATDLAAERMAAALHPPVLAAGHELTIRASIGIADGHTGDEASVLLRQADIAMYAAKNVAGTAHLHYSGRMTVTGTDGAHLRAAIEQDQLFLLYQPIVALADARVIGAEALVRWAHPVRGPLAPDAFIPIAERTGLIVPLGRWVLRAALRQLADWTAQPVLNVNVSARELREPDYAAFVAALLHEYDLPGDRITLEVTETMALELGQSVATLHDLRALGIRVSLDDFGTGHSPLTLLHDCPVDEIKLDRAFTQSSQAPIAAAVIHLARALGLHAVAEGVETPEQAAHLLALGYQAAQGYHFARPMPAAELSELMDSGKSLTPAAA
jgi:diguanylate cyclase (GGDEF)-like protein